MVINMSTITTTICPKIDMHSHLIYGVDDGSDSLETTKEALNSIKEIGIKKIICTPHFEALKNKKTITNFNKLKTLFKKNGIELILGFEFKLNLKNINDLKKIKDKNKYILVELDRYENLPFEIIMNLLNEIIDMGYKIILAHPEFYVNYRNIKYIKELKKENIIIQIDSTSLIKKTTSFKIYRYVNKLIKKGLVDIIASDYHDNHIRNYSCFNEAYNYIKNKYGTEKVNQLFYENPLIIVENIK